MMRRIYLLAAVVAAAAGLVFGVSAGSAGDQPTVISLLSVQQGGSLIDVDRSGGRGPTLGDEFIFTDGLSMGRQEARQAGRHDPRHCHDYLAYDCLLHRDDRSTRWTPAGRGLLPLHRTGREDHRTGRNGSLWECRWGSDDHEARRRELESFVVRRSPRSVGCVIAYFVKRRRKA